MKLLRNPLYHDSGFVGLSQQVRRLPTPELVEQYAMLAGLSEPLRSVALGRLWLIARELRRRGARP